MYINVNDSRSNNNKNFLLFSDERLQIHDEETKHDSQQKQLLSRQRSRQ